AELAADGGQHRLQGHVAGRGDQADREEDGEGGRAKVHETTLGRGGVLRKRFASATVALQAGETPSCPSAVRWPPARRPLSSPWPGRPKPRCLATGSRRPSGRSCPGWWNGGATCTPIPSWASMKRGRPAL